MSPSLFVATSAQSRQPLMPALLLLDVLVN
jgi:hypothetical protein